MFLGLIHFLVIFGWLLLFGFIGLILTALGVHTFLGFLLGFGLTYFIVIALLEKTSSCCEANAIGIKCLCDPDLS